jgi:hypothetical protein
MPIGMHPRQFWSHTKVAVMSIPKRSKGRVQHPDAGYVNHMSILPEQFTGGQADLAEMPPRSRPRQFLGQRKNAEMSFHTHPRGANHHPQKCYVRCAPISYRGHCENAEVSRHCFPEGAMPQTQKCQLKTAPAIFIWCRDHLAEMPLLKRTKGRAKILLQKCHVTNALPKQLQGFNAQSQKCHDAHNPRKGAKRRTQKCHFLIAPTEFGSFMMHRNVIRQITQ